MRYGIFADIHSNLEALRAVLSAFTSEKIDEYYCCGDIVGYGANPCECICEVKRVSSVCVAGNHDWAVAQKIDTDNFNVHATDAVVWTRAQISLSDKEFLRDLDLVYHTDDFILVHGTLDCPQDFDYLNDVDQARRSFALMNRPICFVGHSHIPRIFIEKEGGVVDLSEFYKIELAPGCRYIINVGSVGQPRDGNPQAAYCIFDSKDKTIEIKRVEYDVASAKNKILEAGLPSELAARLGIGK